MKKDNTEAYVKALKELEKSGRDGFGKIGHGVLTALGAAGLIAAAPAIAGAIGIGTATLGGSTILGSAALALGGGALVTITAPVWVTGTVALGGAAAAYGLGKVLLDSGRQNERRDRLKEDLAKKIADARAQMSRTNDNDQVKLVADRLHTALIQKKIPMEEGARIITMLEKQEITPEFALDIMQEYINHETHGVHLSDLEKELIERLKIIDPTQAQSIVIILSQGQLTLEQAFALIEDSSANTVDSPACAIEAVEPDAVTAPIVFDVDDDNNTTVVDAATQVEKTNLLTQGLNSASSLGTAIGKKVRDIRSTIAKR